MSDAVEAGDDETDEMLDKNAEEIDEKEMIHEEEEKEVITHEEEIISEENEEERDKEIEEEEEAMTEDQQLDQKEKDADMIDKDGPAPRYDPAVIAQLEGSDNGYLAMRSDSLQSVDPSVISVPARQKVSGGVEEGDAIADGHSMSADRRRAKSGGQPTEQKSAHRESLKGGEEGAGRKKEAMDRYFLRNRGSSVRWVMGGPILLSLALNSLYCKLTT